MRDALMKIMVVLVGFTTGSATCLAAQDTGAINDEDTKAVYFETLRYPLGGRLSHVQGVVVIRAKLDNAGNVADVEAISGPKSLISESLANAKKWRFRPNSRKTVVLVYSFRIDDGLCHGTVSSQFTFHPPNFATITSCEAVVD